MRRILPQSFTVVFFPANFIADDKVFDLATEIKQHLHPTKLQVNNSVSLPPGIPSPFPLISAFLPSGWNVSVNINRVDCVFQHFDFKDEIPEDFYNSLVPLFTTLSSMLFINRIGIVGRFQDLSDTVYKEISNRFLVSILKQKQAKFNSLGFYIKREENGISFFDNFQVVRQEINQGGKKVEFFLITRDLNTGIQENRFTEDTLQSFFNTARSLLSMPKIKEELYGDGEQ